MTPDTFLYIALVTTGAFCVAMFVCDVAERRAERRSPRQSGEYPHSNVKEQ